jgi:prepilin-type N-terminal cleavage/methylation domain-containing protein
MSCRNKYPERFFAQAPRAAFTLLEVMLAVAILALVAVCILRFVESSLQAIALSTAQRDDEAAVTGLMRVLQAQINDLPPTRPGALLGEPHRFNDLAADEMQWICGPGIGLFTRHAKGDYKVTLALKPGRDRFQSELGIRRLQPDANERNAVWLGLIEGVKALEIRYFDMRLNAWLEKWTDQSALPNLIRIRIWRTNNAEPYEQILSFPLGTRSAAP